MDKKTEALKQAREALKIGYDYAVDETQRFHVEMAGYKPKRHEAMDADVRQIDKAIAVIDEALAEQQAPYGWAVTGLSSLFMGEFAEHDAKAEAKRVGGTSVAFPLYKSPPARKPLTDEEQKT